MFAMFAIKTCQINQNKIFGHLLRGISRAAKFLYDRVANLTHLSSTHYRRSPLFQGRIEIPRTVKVCFPLRIKSDMLIRKYKEIVESLYIQPKNEFIVGCFIKKNDYDKGENSIGLPMKQERKMFQKN